MISSIQFSADFSSNPQKKRVGLWISPASPFNEQRLNPRVLTRLKAFAEYPQFTRTQFGDEKSLFGRNQVRGIVELGKKPTDPMTVYMKDSTTGALATGTVIREFKIAPADGKILSLKVQVENGEPFEHRFLDPRAMKEYNCRLAMMGPADADRRKPSPSFLSETPKPPAPVRVTYDAALRAAEARNDTRQESIVIPSPETVFPKTLAGRNAEFEVLKTNAAKAFAERYDVLKRREDTAERAQTAWDLMVRNVKPIGGGIFWEGSSSIQPKESIRELKGLDMRRVFRASPRTLDEIPTKGMPDDELESLQQRNRNALYDLTCWYRAVGKDKRPVPLHPKMDNFPNERAAVLEPGE